MGEKKKPHLEKEGSEDQLGNSKEAPKKSRQREEGRPYLPGLYTLHSSPPGTDSDKHMGLIGKSHIPVFRTGLIWSPSAAGVAELLSSCGSDILQESSPTC